jgi:hypothetical protein
MNDRNLTLDIVRSYAEACRDRSLAGKLAVGGKRVRSGANGRFIFIDTVVSGRAISEIMDAFSAHGLTNCHFLLLIDERGRKLRPECDHIIREMEARGRATRILVDNIFTEDEGPAMSGIWTVTMPEVMLAAQHIPGLHDEIAATFFYWEVRRREDESNLAITVSTAQLSTLLCSAVVGKDDVTAGLLSDFQEHVGGENLRRKEVTKQIAEPVITANLQITSLDVSSSHVIRAHVGMRRVDDLIRGFRSSL